MRRMAPAKRFINSERSGLIREDGRAKIYGRGSISSQGDAPTRWATGRPSPV
jgi:phenylalanine-4-hydroxylase